MLEATKLKVQHVAHTSALDEVLRAYDVPSVEKGWVKSKEQLLGQVHAGECVLATIAPHELIVFAWRSQANVYRIAPEGVRQKLCETIRIVNGIPQKTRRKVSISEKIWAFKGETPLQAMVRCLFEELGIKDVDPSSLKQLRRFVSKLSPSSSFPLKSQSCVTLYEYEIPYEESRESYCEERNDKVTHWEWRDYP